MSIYIHSVFCAYSDVVMYTTNNNIIIIILCSSLTSEYKKLALHEDEFVGGDGKVCQ